MSGVGDNNNNEAVATPPTNVLSPSLTSSPSVSSPSTTTGRSRVDEELLHQWEKLSIEFSRILQEKWAAADKQEQQQPRLKCEFCPCVNNVASDGVLCDACRHSFKLHRVLVVAATPIDEDQEINKRLGIPSTVSDSHRVMNFAREQLNTIRDKALENNVRLNKGSLRLANSPSRGSIVNHAMFLSPKSSIPSHGTPSSSSDVHSQRITAAVPDYLTPINIKASVSASTSTSSAAAVADGISATTTTTSNLHPHPQRPDIVLTASIPTKVTATPSSTVPITKMDLVIPPLATPAAPVLSHRERILGEILSSEVTYVSHLTELMIVFFYPLKDMIKPEQHSTIFSNIQTIYEFHKILLEDLSLCAAAASAAKIDLASSSDTLSSSSASSGALSPFLVVSPPLSPSPAGGAGGGKRVLTLGDVFIKLSPFMMLYRKYVENYKEANKLLEHFFANNNKFIAFVESRTSTQNLGFGARFLQSLLITPIQRIPRYELLLKEVIKNTPETHSDHEKLRRAYENVRVVADFLNTGEKRIVGWAGSSTTLIDIVHPLPSEGLSSSGGEVSTSNLPSSGGSGGVGGDDGSKTSGPKRISIEVQTKRLSPSPYTPSTPTKTLGGSGGGDVSSPSPSGIGAPSGTAASVSSTSTSTSSSSADDARVLRHSKSMPVHAIKNHVEAPTVVTKDEISTKVDENSPAARKLSRTLRSSSLSGDHPKISRRKRRVKVIEEIILTEESYVAQLGEMIELFAKPLEPIIGKDCYQIIFGNVPTLHQFHTILLEDLHTCKVRALAPIVGVFTKLVPFMMIYQGYINNYTTAYKVIENLKHTNPRFIEHVAKCESKLPNMPPGEDLLSSFLISPIQRIPRYEMLLKELIKYSDPEDVAYGQLNTAFTNIRRLANFLNKGQKDLGWATTSRSSFDVNPIEVAQEREMHRRGSSNPIMMTTTNTSEEGITASSSSREVRERERQQRRLDREIRKSRRHSTEVSIGHHHAQGATVSPSPSSSSLSTLVPAADLEAAKKRLSLVGDSSSRTSSSSVPHSGSGGDLSTPSSSSMGGHSDYSTASSSGVSSLAPSPYPLSPESSFTDLDASLSLSLVSTYNNPTNGEGASHEAPSSSDNVTVIHHDGEDNNIEASGPFNVTIILSPPTDHHHHHAPSAEEINLKDSKEKAEDHNKDESLATTSSSSSSSSSSSEIISSSPPPLDAPAPVPVPAPTTNEMEERPRVIGRTTSSYVDFIDKLSAGMSTTSEPTTQPPQMSPSLEDSATTTSTVDLDEIMKDE